MIDAHGSHQPEAATQIIICTGVEDLVLMFIFFSVSYSSLSLFLLEYYTSDPFFLVDT